MSISADSTIICADVPNELGWAIGKASQEAKKTGKTVWVYSHLGFLHASSTYPEGMVIRAKCWPGGRNEIVKKRR